jgi:hypothetical protein
MQKPLVSRWFGLTPGDLGLRLRNESLSLRPVVSTLQNRNRTSPEKISFPTKTKRCETALLNRLKGLRKRMNQIFWKCPKMLRNDPARSHRDRGAART